RFPAWQCAASAPTWCAAKYPTRSRRRRAAASIRAARLPTNAAGVRRRCCAISAAASRWPAMRWRSNATMNEPGHYEAMSTSPLMPAPDACSTSAEPASDPRQSSAAAAPATAAARASAAASPAHRIAVVIGSGGIGGALAEALRSAAEYDEVVVLGRRSAPALDLLDEASIAACARWLAARGASELVIDATGILHGPDMAPEKSWRELDPATLAQAFAINAIGPALLMKHFLPLLPRDRRAVFATLSAKVGSIGDNRLGGWYAYRASKAALNQLVRTASVELRRNRPQ